MQPISISGYPEWAQSDAELMKRATVPLEQMEDFQRWTVSDDGAWIPQWRKV
jgi:hypothetical protein